MKKYLALAMFMLPVLVFAQGLPQPTVPLSGTALTLEMLRQMITTFATFLIVVSVIIAVIFIVWGGIMYMMAGDDSSKTSAAKSKIFNGILGALVVLAVGLILATVASVADWSFFNFVP